MPSSTSAGAIPAGPPSTLSPNAAPYTLLARQVRAPPGRLHDGDASRLIDNNFVLNGEDNSSCSVPLAAQFGMKQSDTVYSSCAHGTRQGQPSSACGIPVGVYPSPASSIGIVSEPSVTIASDFKQHLVPSTSGKGSRQPRVTIRSPPNKTSETNSTVFGSVSKLAIRQNDESNKETGKHVSFGGNLELSNPVRGNGNSKGTMVLSKELNPEFSVKPLVPSACASSCVTMADDVNPDPSECSVDSPCWRGTASRLSPFDGLPTLVGQSVKQEPVAFDAGQEQSSSNHCEPPTKVQNLVSSKSTQNRIQSHVELGLSKEPGDIGTNITQYAHGKEQFAKHGAANCNADKHCLAVIDDCIKRSGLNSAAPDFVPLSIRKSNTGDGSCFSSGANISGILEAIKSLSEVLCNNFSGEIELEEHDHCLLQSVIENLQSCLHKASKVPVMVASDKSGGLKACYAQNAVSKSVTGDYNGSCTADNGKGIIISNLGDSSRLVGDLRKKSVTGYQSALSNFSKELSCEEEHPQAVIYKNLWFDAERANFALKYQLKQTLVEVGLESSMAHIGGGRRNHSLHLCDMGVDPSSSYGSAITCPLMVKGHPGGRKTHNLLSAADHIQSGDSSVLSRSKGCIAVPENIKDEYFLSGSDETGVHRHAHPGLQVAPSRALRRLNTSTSDGMSSSSYITGRDDILRGSCEFGSSDWEHVLKEEIGST
ncbi:hypothetical protein BDA96_07G050400 [Sorghum bicolor]|uniref:Uncharacterized protein n=2 Tax=Sorghum bicolor TaxID=4558 RepID=A0A921QLE8_SORBI|nr:hypothetical protein BDA96_07G050400 [Sorghum bicolor]KXG24478.1 hypothetical protein SORBI_3007G047600 [Sorghum bicolor]